jgi:hypothetical protein
MLFNINFRNKNILILGCGGGYDIFCGLPLYFELINNNNVNLASFSFTNKNDLKKFESITQNCYKVNAKNHHIDDNIYFPEYKLSKCINSNIYCINTHTTISIYENAIRTLIIKDNIDIVIIADGGCDSILSGKEEDLATPVEDMMTVFVINKLKKEKNIYDAYLICLGTTVELINKEDFKINLESIKEKNGLIYKISLKDNRDYDPIKKYVDIFKQCDTSKSIINSSIIASIEGHIGRYVNPMLYGRISCDHNFPFLDDGTSIMWIFDLEIIANHIIYLTEFDKLDDNEDIDAFIIYMNYQFHPPKRPIDYDFLYGKERMEIIVPLVMNFFNGYQNANK